MNLALVLIFIFLLLIVILKLDGIAKVLHMKREKTSESRSDLRETLKQLVSTFESNLSELIAKMQPDSEKIYWPQYHIMSQEILGSL